MKGDRVISAQLSLHLVYFYFKASFTRIVNVPSFVGGTFDVFDRHFVTLTHRMGVQPILPLRPVYTYRLRVRRRLRKIYIESMVIVRMSSVPILPIKRIVTIGAMLYFDGDGDADGMCKQALSF